MKRNQYTSCIALIVVVITTFAVGTPMASNEPDLEGYKGEHIYFLLGCLDEYSGRRDFKDETTVEHFYCSEQLHAHVFAAFLERVGREQGLNTEVLIEQWDCFTDCHSRELREFVDSFYDERHLSYDKFRGRGDNLKYAFLAGAYFRYGKGNSFKFANASEKAQLILRLLLDLECGDLMICTRPSLPGQKVVSYEPTDELLKWFKKYPGLWGLQEADSLMGLASTEELSIYREVIEKARHGAFDGCELSVPCVTRRTSGVSLEEFDVPNIPKRFETAMEDYKTRFQQVVSLKGLESGLIRVKNDVSQVRQHTSTVFLSRIGFSKLKKYAVVFIGYRDLDADCQGQMVAVFLEKRRFRWEVTQYSVKEPRKQRRR